jgi:hypothetical protein
MNNLAAQFKQRRSTSRRSSSIVVNNESFVIPAPINDPTAGGATINKNYFKLKGRMVESESGSDIAPHIRQQESSIIINALNTPVSKPSVITDDKGMMTDDLYHFNMNKNDKSYAPIHVKHPLDKIDPIDFSQKPADILKYILKEYERERKILKNKLKFVVERIKGMRKSLQLQILGISEEFFTSDEESMISSNKKKSPISQSPKKKSQFVVEKQVKNEENSPNVIQRFNGK